MRARKRGFRDGVINGLRPGHEEKIRFMGEELLWAPGGATRVFCPKHNGHSVSLIRHAHEWYRLQNDLPC